MARAASLYSPIFIAIRGFTFRVARSGRAISASGSSHNCMSGMPGGMPPYGMLKEEAAFQSTSELKE